MAWFRTWRRNHGGLQLHIGAYKRFDGLALTATDHIVYHGDSRSYELIEADGGLKRYISMVNTKPMIMAGGGTKNTVTTTATPEVAAAYACRGGSSHTVKSKSRYLYAMLLPAGHGIDLVANLPAGLGDRQMAPNNARTQEFLTLDVPLINVLGYVTVAPSAVGGRAIVTQIYDAKSAVPLGNNIPPVELLRFADFQTAESFAIEGV